MKHFVTGGAGFIGSHLVDRLLAEGGEVVVFDNMSVGKTDFLKQHENNPRLKLIKGDILDLKALKEAMKGCEFVWHLAGNSDIRKGMQITDTDLKQGVTGTYNVLEAMRLNGIKRIAFASTSTVYGEATTKPTPETYGPYITISLYAAGKLGSEGFITAFSHFFDMKCWIFRFANVVGPRGTHGVILDFINKLKKNPQELEILGDGSQRKSYVLVDELIDGMLFCVKNANEQYNIFNVTAGDQLPVLRIAQIVVETLGLKDVKFKFTGGKRGWPGDISNTWLSAEKINKLGWRAKHNSEQSVQVAAKALAEEQWK